MRQLVRAVVLYVLIVFAAMLHAAPAFAQATAPLRIHVRGGAQIQAIAIEQPDGIVVRGELVDDVGGAIPKKEVAITAVGADDHKSVRLGPASACDRSRLQLRGGADDVAETDERGAFCVFFRVTGKKLLVRLHYDGKPVHDAADLEVPLESEKDHLARTILRFEPQPDVIDLDRDSVTITASLRVDREDSIRLPSEAVKREGQVISLEDERGHKLAEAKTGGDGRVKLEVKTSDLDGPGEGRLVLSFAGAPPLAKSSLSTSIVRRAEVHLAVSHDIGSVDPNDGFPIDLDAASVRGPVTGGVVEVVHAGESVGAGQVEAGHAHVITAFGSAGKPTAAIAIRYVPSAPWYKSGPEVRVDVRLSGPGIGREILLALVVIGIAGWVVYGWRRAPKPRLVPGVDQHTAPPSGRPGVQVLGPSVGFGGWRGFVSDAHDGSPISGARLKIVVPSFQGDGVVAWATSDEKGAFVLEGQHRSDAKLVVESDDHSTYEQTLPPPSTLAVALVTRRRAILERLVKWAKRQGPPFDGAPEPTPGHVRRAAARSNADGVEAWARKVESAAFGPDRVDATTEQQVRGDEPRPMR